MPSHAYRRFAAAVAVAILAAMATGDQARGSEMPSSGETGQILLAGGQDVLWIVRGGRDTETDKFDLLIRRPGGKWRTLSRFSGSPAAVAAYQDRRLLVVTGGSDPNTHVFSLSDDDNMLLRGTGPGAPWPKRTPPPAAICPAPPLGKSTSSGFIAVVPFDRDRLSTPTTASQPAYKRSGLTILQTVGEQWESLSKVDNIPGAVGARISATVAGNWVYVLVVAEDNGARLLAWDATDRKPTWKDVALANVPQQPLAVSVLQNQPVLITIGRTTTPPRSGRPPKTAHVKLTIHGLRGDKIAGDSQSIEYQGKPLALPGNSIPLACSLGKTSESKLALLWREAEDYQFALVDLNGEVVENKEVEELLKSAPAFDTREILNWFFIAIPVLLLVFILLGRRRRPAGPLILPAQFVPGAIPKRILAVIIDYIPFLLLASMALVVLRPDMTTEDVQALMNQQQNIPLEPVLCVLGSLVAWVVYGSIMESKFGATLGKMAMQLEVTSADGRKPTVRQAILRNLIRPIELSWPIIIFTLAIPLLMRTHQRLGDIMARTVVVEKGRLANPDDSQQSRQEPPKEI